MESLNKTLFLDLETTGFGSTAEILQIGIIDSDGNVLMNQFIKPTVCELTDKWTHAIEIHCITPERVANCPSFLSVIPALKEILTGCHLVIFNKSFDMGFLPDEVKQVISDVSCCMASFALAYQGCLKPSKSLKFACEHIGYASDKEHDAIGDCVATLHVWNWIKNKSPNS